MKLLKHKPDFKKIIDDENADPNQDPLGILTKVRRLYESGRVADAERVYDSYYRRLERLNKEGNLVGKEVQEFSKLNRSRKLGPPDPK